MSSIFGDVTREIIDLIYNESKRKHNKRKLKYIFDMTTGLLLDNIKPYLYTILAILILMFTMNVFQFYYYIRMFINKDSNSGLGNLVGNVIDSTNLEFN